MIAFLHTPVVADIVLGGFLLEVAGLWVWRRVTGGGPRLGLLAPTLASGVCLVWALRAALGGGAGWQVGAGLIGALACHVADLRLRWPVRDR